MSAQPVILKNSSPENPILALCPLSQPKQQLISTKQRRKNKMASTLLNSRSLLKKLSDLIRKEWARGERIDNAIREARAKPVSMYEQFNHHKW